MKEKIDLSSSLNSQSGIVRTMLLGEEETVAAVLVEAFDRDPLAQWLYPDRDRRRSNLHKLFSNILLSPPLGAAIEVTANLDAVAIWLPPNSKLDSEPPDTASEAQALFALIEEATPDIPFWYLAFIGVKTSGTGSGSALMQHRLNIIRGAIALWTGNEKNLRFYEKFGFKPISEHRVLGVNAWWLTRSI